MHTLPQDPAGEVVPSGSPVPDWPQGQLPGVLREGDARSEPQDTADTSTEAVPQVPADPGSSVLLPQTELP